ncbi:phage baseplate assembly protein [Gluconobacter sp. LMG 31484]|uniref:Phage baseplate assembly protein n=1 Tax=Gluconobacter vitians TaxID=2728102 RepID=A0ABR9Y663_9PROT|nr:phage baseplate assembly protein [Gluconobacter vitians]MBF0859425.1 phage baseplate assembly protein [Gluconobacter vitians]
MSSLARLARRVAMAFGLGRQTADTNESRSTSTVQVALASGELRSDVPVMQLYGFASRSVPGSDLALMFISGDRTRAVAVASGDQRNRPSDLSPGDVAVYHPRTGSRIWLKGDGSIEISPAAKKLTINAEVTIAGSLNASGDVKAGKISLQNHLTTDVESGSGKSGPPASS